MATNREAYDHVIQRRNEYLERKKRRQAVIVKTAAAASGLCAAAAIVSGICMNSQILSPEVNNISVEVPAVTEVQETTCVTQTVSAERPELITETAETSVTRPFSETCTDQISSSSEKTKKEETVTSSEKQELSVNRRPETSAVISEPLHTRPAVTEVIVTEPKPVQTEPPVTDITAPDPIVTVPDEEEIYMKNTKTIAFISALLLTASPDMIVSHASEYHQPKDGTIEAVMTYIDSDTDRFDFDGNGVFNRDDIYALYAYLKAPELMPEGYAKKVEDWADVNKDGKIDQADYDLLSVYKDIALYEGSKKEFEYGTEEMKQLFFSSVSSANLGTSDVQMYINDLLNKSFHELEIKAEKGELNTDINGDGITDFKDMYDLFVYYIHEKCSTHFEYSHIHPELSEADLSRLSERSEPFAEFLRNDIGINRLIRFYIENYGVKASELTPETYRDIYNINYDDSALVLNYDAEDPLDVFYRYNADPANTRKEYLIYTAESYFILNTADRMRTIEEISEDSENLKTYRDGVITSSGDYYFYEFDDHAVLWRYYGSDEEIIIPDEVNGKPVTAANNYALSVDLSFRNPAKYVEFPDDIKVIQTYFLMFNPNVENIKFPKNLVEIEDDAFYGLHLKSIDLPEGLEKIGNEVFRGNKADSVTIPKSVTYIGENAFAQNWNEHEAVYPENIYVYSGSYGEKYVTENNIPHIVIDEAEDAQKFSDSVKNGLMTGDIDGNGIIDISDLTMLSQFVMNDITLSRDQLNAADCNGDGMTDITDLALLKQYVMNDNVKLGK